MAPVSDLRAVAGAGRSAKLRFQSAITDSDVSSGALPVLLLSLLLDLGHGGTFDFQRQANVLSGYTQFRQYAAISNFNVGLLCQQAGLTLGETLTIAGTYARLRSSNARLDLPYGRDSRAHEFTVKGYEAGATGVFEKSEDKVLVK